MVNNDCSGVPLCQTSWTCHNIPATSWYKAITVIELFFLLSLIANAPKVGWKVFYGKEYGLQTIWRLWGCKEEPLVDMRLTTGISHIVFAPGWMALVETKWHTPQHSLSPLEWYQQIRCSTVRSCDNSCTVWFRSECNRDKPLSVIGPGHKTIALSFRRSCTFML